MKSFHPHRGWTTTQRRSENEGIFQDYVPEIAAERDRRLGVRPGPGSEHSDSTCRTGRPTADHHDRHRDSRQRHGVVGVACGRGNPHVRHRRKIAEKGRPQGHLGGAMKYVLPFLIVMCAVFPMSAFAALDNETAAATSAIATQVNDLVSWAWPVVAAMLTFTVGAKLLKKVAHKAT